MAMPERIWVGPRAEIGKPMGGDWYSIRTPGTPVQYVSATTHQRTVEALREVIAATSAYLPPDGISAQECLNRILAATDNPDINTIMGVGNGRS